MEWRQLTFAGQAAEGKSMLSNAKIVDQIEVAPQMLRDLLAEMEPQLLKRRPAADRWSAHEHALHLAEVDPLFSVRLDSMLTEEDPAVVPYIPSAEDEMGALMVRDLSHGLDTFESGRERLVQRLRSLGDDSWRRSAKHPDYPTYDVRIMFRHAVLHDMLHCYRIEELLLKKDWT